ncbi:MAG: HAD family phosphatase [Lachnospiraceae bacterium]|nr:HAD family phosphatase [Lachnospiraceae bacterium]
MKAVIFDMDGVIFDSERAYIECWEPIDNKYQIPDLKETLLKCIGVTSDVSKNIFLKKYGEDFPLDEYRKIAGQGMAELVESGKLEKKPGIVELLVYLKNEGIALAVASSTKTETVKWELDLAGLKDYFDVIIGGDMVKKSKPNPDIFLEAAKKLGANPSQCVVIEDSFNGIRAAKAAKMTAYMVPDLLAPDDEMREKADEIFASLIEVKKYLECL